MGEQRDCCGGTADGEAARLIEQNLEVFRSLQLAGLVIDENGERFSQRVTWVPSERLIDLIGIVAIGVAGRACDRAPLQRYLRGRRPVERNVEDHAARTLID